MTEEGRTPMTIEEAVKKGGYIGPTIGVSMLPMLKEGRDSIVVRPKSGRLAPYDVALYKRGEDYVLHRVIAVLDDGYLIRGDNCYSDEHILEEDVFGVLTEYFRKNKHVLITDKKYLRYAEKRVKNYPRRRKWFFFKKKIKEKLKKLLGRG